MSDVFDENICFENEVLRLKNAKLKELLKECRPFVEMALGEDDIPNQNNEAFELLDKLDEVLNE